LSDFDGAETLKLMPLLVPPFVATVTVLFPGLADALMVKATVNDVEPATCGESTVMPEPVICTMVPPATKFVPVKVAVTVIPAVPDVGLIEARVGGTAGAKTLKLTPLLVPPFVATVTVLFPGLADALIVKATVNEVEPVT